MTGRDAPAAPEWRWVDIGGEQHKVRLDELVEALRRGRLPPHVLVWRTGWSEWLPAANTGELRHAFTADQSGPAASVRVDASLLAPPPPPLGHYALKVPRGTLTLERPGISSTPPPRPNPRPGPPTPPRSPGAPVPMRNVMPTLSEEEGQPLRSNTLRPMGALPPPPRAIPPPKRPPFSSIPPVGVRPMVPTLKGAPRTPVPPEPVAKPPPAPPAAGGDPSPRVAPAAAPPPRVPADEAARTSSSAPPPPSARGKVESEPSASAAARSAPEAADTDARTSNDTRRPVTDGVGGVSRRTVTILTSAAVLIPGIVLLTLALLKGPRKPAQEAVASAPAATALPAQPSAAVKLPKPPGRCVVDKPAQRLAESTYLAVPALVAAAPDGTHTVIGFAATKEHAVGLSLDLETLATTSAFEQTVSGSTTLGVVPLVRSGLLEFTVDRADPQFASARTIDAPKRFTIGATSEGVSRAIGTVKDVVWARDTNSAITTPRVASITGNSHAVVFRQGGQEGGIVSGWLNEDGSKLTELRTVKSDAALVGTPAIAADEHGVVVAFAAKPSPTDSWHIELATAAKGTVPEHSRAFSLPGGGPGGEAISPAVEALGDGRFLLQWTEGSAGNRAVRAQVIAVDLVSVGDPVNLSGSDQNAGQGALFARGTGALALFLVQKESAHELWGASLKCP